MRPTPHVTITRALAAGALAGSLLGGISACAHANAASTPDPHGTPVTTATSSTTKVGTFTVTKRDAWTRYPDGSWRHTVTESRMKALTTTP